MTLTDLFRPSEIVLSRTRGFEVVSPHFKESTNGITLPTRGSKKSAGYDFYSPRSFTLSPGEETHIATDVKAYMQDDEVLQIYPRSSTGSKGMMIVNTVGIIDSDYYSNPRNDGNIIVYLKNAGNKVIYIDEGDRFVQGIFQKYLTTDGDDFISGADRLGGYGHTGN